MKAIAVAVALAVCAVSALPAARADQAAPAAAASQERTCFRVNRVRGFKVIDEHNVRVRVGASRFFLLTLEEDVSSLDREQNLALTSDSAGTVCTGDTMGVSLVGGFPSWSYRVHSIALTTNEDPPAQPSNEG